MITFLSTEHLNNESANSIFKRSNKIIVLIHRHTSFIPLCDSDKRQRPVQGESKFDAQVLNCSIVTKQHDARGTDSRTNPLSPVLTPERGAEAEPAPAPKRETQEAPAQGLPFRGARTHATPERQTQNVLHPEPRSNCIPSERGRRVGLVAETQGLVSISSETLRSPLGAESTRGCSSRPTHCPGDARVVAALLPSESTLPEPRSAPPSEPKKRPRSRGCP